jgi:hypothetical protein
MTMFADMFTGLAPWEIVALSAICAWAALGIAFTVATILAYVLTRQPQVVSQPAPRAVQPQPEPTAMIPVAG